MLKNTWKPHFIIIVVILFTTVVSSILATTPAYADEKTDCEAKGGTLKEASVNGLGGVNKVTYCDLSSNSSSSNSKPSQPTWVNMTEYKDSSSCEAAGGTWYSMNDSYAGNSGAWCRKFVNPSEIQVTIQANSRDDCIAKGGQWIAYDSSSGQDITMCLAGENSSTVDDPEGGDSEGGEDEDPVNDCNVEGVGWILCPVMRFMAFVNDTAFDIISRFLTVKPKLFDTSGATFTTWKGFRDIANSLFVLMFLIIIASQISSIGISNYGIKKLLPRLVVGAVLINISFFICQLAVDLSNIIGSSIPQVIFSATGTLKPGEEAINPGSNDWVTAIGAVLVIGTAIGAGAMLIGFAGTMLLMSLLSVIVIIVILVGRQAALILLIVISPLAFAARLLPNTESLFKKWWKVFSALLLVFPIFGLLYGGASLASSVIDDVAVSRAGDPDEMLQLVALAIMFIPLGLTPMILRSSLNSLGSFGTKLGNLSQKASGKALGEAKDAIGASSLGMRAKELGEYGKRKRARNVARRRAAPGGLQKKFDQSKVGKFFGAHEGSYAAQAAVVKAEKEAAANAFEYEYEGDAEAALRSDNSRVVDIAMETLKGKGSWGADKIDNFLAKGGKISSRNQAETLSDMKSVHAGLAQAGTAALRQFDGPSYEKKQAMTATERANAEAKRIQIAKDGIQYSEEQLNDFSAKGVGGLNDNNKATQAAGALSRAIASDDKVIDSNKAQEMLNDPRLTAQMTNSTKTWYIERSQGKIPGSP